MDIIPVIDILNNQVVRAIKGDRDNYKSINYALYNSTDPRDIIDQIARKYSPKILYIADLDAIVRNTINFELYDNLLSSYPRINFWIDSGLKDIKLNHMVFPSFFLLAVALVGTFFNPFELYGGFPMIISKEEGKCDGNSSCK